MRIIQLSLNPIGERIRLLVSDPANVHLEVWSLAVHEILNPGLMSMTSDGVHLVPFGVLTHLAHSVEEHDAI